VLIRHVKLFKLPASSWSYGNGLCFFRVFKRDHLQSFCANRLDDLFFSVVNFAKETRIKRSVFAAKNIPSSRMRTVSLQHRAAVAQAALYELQRDEEMRWICTKSTLERPSYVLAIQPCNVLSCGIGCAGCINFCLHRISCGCPDALGGSRYCKPAHLLCMKLMKSEHQRDLFNPGARPQQVGAGF